MRVASEPSQPLPGGKSMHDPNLNTLRRPTGQAAPPVHPTVTLIGVFELLVNEHQRATELLRRVTTESTEERRTSWPLVRRQLLSHDRAEALEVYSALDGYDAARDILVQH